MLQRSQASLYPLLKLTGDDDKDYSGLGSPWIQEVAENLNITVHEARRLITEKLDLAYREKLTKGKSSRLVTDVVINHGEGKQMTKSTKKQIETANPQRQFIKTPLDLKYEDEGKAIASKTEYMGVKTRKSGTRKCRGCNIPVDDLNPSCPTCRGRHKERRLLKAKRERALQAQSQSVILDTQAGPELNQEVKPPPDEVDVPNSAQPDYFI